jgi:hypothetical protein
LGKGAISFFLQENAQYLLPFYNNNDAVVAASFHRDACYGVTPELNAHCGKNLKTAVIGDNGIACVHSSRDGDVPADPTVPRWTPAASNAVVASHSRDHFQRGHHFRLLSSSNHCQYINRILV